MEHTAWTKKTEAVEISRKLLRDEEFKGRHRAKATAFTRIRTLTFSCLIILLLKKSLKSLQLALNEPALEQNAAPVTVGAFTQARANLHHTAFIELNQKAVVNVMYSDNNVILYKGMRVSGIDGSKILLPQHKSVIKEFGEISYSNDHPGVQGRHACGLAPVMCDALNNTAIDSASGKARDYEVDLAVGHPAFCQDNDLLIFDRNYPSCVLLALLMLCGKKFVIRCSGASFGTARMMLKGEGADDRIVTLAPHHTKLEEVRFHGLPEEIQVRFVRVLLDTGEYEALAASLMDNDIYPAGEFKKIYHMRRGAEGFYKILKSRLNLENFTGKTAEPVCQDFYAAVYLSGLESILTLYADEALAEKETLHPQQVNHAVSFNAIKNKAFDLLASDLDSEILIARLETLFLMNPTVIRQDRNPPRKKRSARHRLNYVKRELKICF